LSSVTQFGQWTIAYENSIPADLPTLEGISRDTTNSNTKNQDKENGTQSSSGTKDNKGTNANTSNNSSNDANKTNQGNTTLTENPGWLLYRGKPISHVQAEAVYGSKKSASRSTQTNIAYFASLAIDATPEITELARALGNDPKLIYDYVHNHIDYVPYFGSLKGATLTYLDGTGNDFDQASLMIALLRVWGYNAQYVYGTMTIPGSQLANWLGVDQQSGTIGKVLPSGGIPVSNIQADGTATVTRVWVTATINGIPYLFDPAFKSYTYNSKINLGQAMGYNQSDFLAAATTGATVGPNYVQNLNETNLRNKLATYATNLVGAVRSQYPNNEVKEIIGGRKIVQTNLTSYATTLPFTPTSTDTWSDIPASKITTLRIQHVGINYQFNTPDLSGKRLTLTYAGSNNHPVITLDGYPVASGTATTLGSKNNFTLIITHPYTAVTQTTTYQPQSGSSYAIVYNFGGSSDALLQKRQHLLDDYIATGLSNTSESVLGETLNIMGQTWFKETQLVNRLLSAIADTVYVQHHMVGLMAQEAGYYIDVKTATCSITSKHNFDADWLAHFKESGLIMSAFEHGILKQLMGADGVSTMQLFQISNATKNSDGTWRKVYLIPDLATFNTISSQLSGYDIASLQSYLNGGNALILPSNGQLCVGMLMGQSCTGQWTGDGYIVKKFSGDYASMGMIIGGGYHGGYASTTGSVNTPTVSYYNDLAFGTNYSSSTISSNVTPLPAVTSSEPVDMTSGAYLYDSTDLSLGGGAPLGLSFSRSYNSNFNRTKRDMGYGWTHNYDIYLVTNSHGDPGMGMRQPIDAASFIAALYAALDIVKTQDNITGWMTASLASKWAVDQVIDNAVTVHLGSKMMEFIKLADGTFASPPGITTQLIKNGDSSFSLKERSGTKIDFDLTNKWITQITDVDSNAMTFSYVGTKLDTVRDAFNRTLSLGYNADGNVNLVTDSTGSVSYGYNTAGELTSYTDPESKIWRYGYETGSTHRMTTLTNPLAITTATNVYDSLSRVKTQTVPRQGGTNVTYNFYFSGFRNAEADPYNHTITYYFDDKGREITRENALGQKSSKKYDGQNHTVMVTDPRLNSTSYQYDDQNNLTKVISAITTTMTYAYDPATFDLTDVTDALLHNTHFGYDTHHHLTSTRDDVGNTTGATYNGPKNFRDTATDGRGFVSNFTYDSFGNPYTAKTTTHPQITYAYDPIGMMTGLTDQISSQTTFTYDKRGLLKTKIDPTRTNFTSYTYYDDGKLQTKTDRLMSTITYTYTPSGKLDTITYPNASTVHFTYDHHDRLIQMWDLIGVTTYAPDALGRPSTITDPQGFAVSYTYDEAGNIKELTYPGNKKVIYTYDELNRLKTVTIDWLTARPVAIYNYKPLETGLLDNFVNFNGLVTAYSYDTAHRLTGIASSIASYQFTDIDGNGNRKQIVQNEPLTPTLATSNTPYAYNATGTRLLSAGSYGFGYDNEGQLSSGYGSGYTFDYEHRLTSISTDYYPFTYYYYDGMGNRLDGVRSGVITRYIYDAAGNLLAEVDADTATITRYYIYGAGLLAMVTPAGDVYNYHYNAIGSTIALTDQSRTMVNKYAYDPFGAVINQVEAVPQPFKYVGQFGVMAEPNGFYYMKARYYDPRVGRFISEDPIGFDGGDVNLYAYVGNNPTMQIDPNGTFYWAGAALGGAIGAVSGGITAAVNHQNFWAGIGIGAATGTLAGFEASGAALGVLAAGGANLLTQLASGISISKIDWASVGLSSGLGAFTGAFGSAGGANLASIEGAAIMQALGEVASSLAFSPVSPLKTSAKGF